MNEAIKNNTAGIVIGMLLLLLLLIILLGTLAPCSSCSNPATSCDCAEGFSNTGFKLGKESKKMYRKIIAGNGSQRLNKKERFQTPKQPGSLNYNANYTSPDLNINGGFIYTQPPGDVKAQAFGKSGQGTSGSFFPLQGHGAPTMMKNSASNNLALPSPDPGQIGGQDNYTTKLFTTEMNGFQNFGSPFAYQEGVPQIFDENYSNSYLIDGGNQRVRNPGQSREYNTALECGDWWPNVGGTDCVDGNSDLLGCEEGDSEKCARFVKSKLTPNWIKVLQNANGNGN
jgi:hypothetical protein